MIPCLQGKLDDAKPLYEEALAIWKKVHGEEHPLVATGLNNLAQLLEALVRLAGFRCRATLIYKFLDT